MDFKVGLLCGLTDKMADFKITCSTFIEDPVLKEERLKQQEALRQFYLEEARIEQENKKPLNVIIRIISIIITIISLIIAFAS